MRILHTIASVDPAGGGPIEGVKQVAAVNMGYGHEIEVASLDAPSCKFVKELQLPVHALGPGYLRYGYSPRMYAWLRANVAKYDAVIVNGIWQYHALATWRAARQRQIPYIVFTHGMLDPWFKHTYPLKHVKKSLYWWWGDYRVLRDAHAVLFTTEEERQLARGSFRLYRCNERVTSYGTAGPTGDAEAQRAALYGQFPRLRGKQIVLFMGRIHPKKGCDIAIEAFAAVLSDRPDVALVMAGPDQLGWRRELTLLVERLGIGERVHWTGMITGAVKWGALQSAEVFFLPSHQENFGIVVAEALACGVPALISNKVNIWREVEAGGAGIVGRDDVEGASSMLRAWAAMDGASRDHMKRRARDCFLENFAIERAAASLIKTLEDVVGNDR